jgi:hypothetical protein
VVIADEDKRKYTEGLDYSDWATSLSGKSGGISHGDILDI